MEERITALVLRTGDCTYLVDREVPGTCHVAFL